jgi:hypothetical protein
MASPPSLAELNRALRLADSFVRPLYRQLNRSWAVTSEYYGLPLRVYVPRDRRWILLGQSGGGTVSQISNGVSEEQARAVFKDGRRGRLELTVEVDWRFRPHAYRVLVRQSDASTLTAPAQVYLDALRLGTVTRRTRGHSWSLVLPARERTPLRSFRYTVRHGAQLAQNYYRYVGDAERFRATARVIRAHGFRLNADLTAPIWGEGAQFADDLPYNSRLAYHDCTATLPATSTAYPYKSKVCTFSPAYLWLSHSDPLAPAVTAIHLLERYDDPDRKANDRRLPLALPVGADPTAAKPAARSPRQIASWLESVFLRQRGAGIGRCLPAMCESGSASGIRTFEFGALETMLGYRFGDRISRSYADAAARIALDVQVGSDGTVRAEAGSFYRPAAAGSFYLAWNHNKQADTAGSLADNVSRALNMRPEYAGLVVSNTETTLTAYAFLVDYRCKRYGVGCPTSSSGPGSRIADEIPRREW